MNCRTFSQKSLHARKKPPPFSLPYQQSIMLLKRKREAFYKQNLMFYVAVYNYANEKDLIIRQVYFRDLFLLLMCSRDVNLLLPHSFLFQSDTFGEGERPESATDLHVGEKLSRSPTPTDHVKEQHSLHDMLEPGTPERLGLCNILTCFDRHFRVQLYYTQFSTAVCMHACA